MNTANYDPSVPRPAEQPHHRGKRCCCCLLRILWGLLVFIIIFFCLLILVPCILIQPQSFKFHVTESKLAQFNYTDNTNTLHYNLVLNFTATNPNKKLKIYYDIMEGNALYKGYRFSTTDVGMPWRSYLQKTKSKDRMSAVFSGQQVILLDQDQVYDFEHDKKDGVFRIDVKLYFTIRFRLGDFIPGDTKGNIKCKLAVPFGSNVNGFEPTKCEVNF